jgi:hypothetical protein
MMWMTNRTPSQRIGTALQSNSPSERRAGPTINGTQRPGFVQAESPVSSGSRVCTQSGVKIGSRHLGEHRILELILNCLCVVLLIVVVVSVGYRFYSWAERGFDKFFDGWAWHEPLNDWNL